VVINGAEAGGGLLRAALPLGVTYQEPLEIINFRTVRREPGLGWPHIAVLSKGYGNERACRYRGRFNGVNNLFG
jgi:hypothetical protein